MPRNIFAIRAHQNEAARISTHLKSPTLMLLVFATTMGAIAYALFLFQPQNRGDLLPYMIVVVAEAFILIQAFVSLWTILASGHEPRGFEFHRTQDSLFSKSGRLTADSHRKAPKSQRMYLHGKEITVDVFITAYGEDVQVVKRTAELARDLLGRHETYILDDGKSSELKKVAKEIGVKYITRPINEGNKAGNVNHSLRLTSAEFFVIFDADFAPDRLFLYETLPFFEDPGVAFVQTPQHYDNLDNILSRGAGFMQHVFYALIQPGKNRFNSAFCVGTNVIFRRHAIEEIGGIYQRSKSEDIWTSLILHEKGYRSVYIPNVLAIGKTPETIKAYSKQQLRWAMGAFEIFFHRNPLFQRSLSIDQKIQYFATSTYYFQGLASLLLLALPPLQIYFNLTPVDLSVSALTWALFYGGFYGLQIVLAFYTMGGFRWETTILGNASSPIYVRALVNTAIGRDQAWQATGRVQRVDSPFNYIIPQLMIGLFLIITSCVGAWKFWYTDQFSLSIVWNTINAVVFSSFIFIAWREARYLKRNHSATDELDLEPQAQGAN